MTDKKRFVISKTLSGVILIKDTKDYSLVATVHKSSRPQGQTEAMAQIMLHALNDALESKNGVQ